MHKTGIWDLSEAKHQHHFSIRLAMAIEQVLPKDVIINDFGCGKGSYIAYLKTRGYRCYGYEGTPGIELISDFHPITHIDLTKPFTVAKGNTICLEVAEHIPKSYEQIFIDNIFNNTDKVLILSWAIKGQGGHGHVNEQDAGYVIDLLTSKGFEYDLDRSLSLRAEGGSELWWFKNSIYVFKRIR
jgi:hypothetical protein